MENVGARNALNYFVQMDNKPKINKDPKNYIVLDFDGTIADTNSHWKSAKNRFLKECGFSKPQARSITNNFTGRNLKDFIRYSCDRAGIFEYDINEMERRIDSDENYIEKVKEIEGSTNFILEQYLSGKKIIICTNSPKRYVMLYLKKHQISQCVEKIYSTYNFCRPKPDPEVYSKISSDVARTNGKILYIIEDSESGIKAANSVGVCCIWLGRSNELKIYRDVVYAKDYKQVEALDIAKNSNRISELA